MNTIIAIDPGKNGGIASLEKEDVTSYPMPETDGDVLDLISNIKIRSINEWSDVVCYVEHVGGYAGGAGSTGSAMFNFGMGFGFLKGVLMTLKIKIILVRPQVWQKVFHLGTASTCASKTEWKNKLKAEAQRLFPEQKVTLKTADALLLLEYARRELK